MTNEAKKSKSGKKMNKEEVAAMEVMGERMASPNGILQGVLGVAEVAIGPKNAEPPRTSMEIHQKRSPSIAKEARKVR